MELTRENAEREARNIIRGQKAPPEEGLALQRVLRSARKFGLARRIFEEIKNHPALQRDAKLRIDVA